MRAIIYYRVRAENIQIATELMEYYSKVIQRDNNIHVTSHTILNIFQYKNDDDPEFFFLDNLHKNQQLKWIQEVNTERKYLEFIKGLRLKQILNLFYRDLEIEHKPALDTLSQLYAKVNDRESENEFLHKAEMNLKPITFEKWTNENTASGTFDNHWNNCTASWRSLTRHTSLFSFPFIRPGMDIYRSYAYDIGRENDEIWYSNVYYLY